VQEGGISIFRIEPSFFPKTSRIFPEEGGRSEFLLAYPGDAANPKRREIFSSRENLIPGEVYPEIEKNQGERIFHACW
jgi:hypothetical protein